MENYGAYMVVYESIETYRESHWFPQCFLSNTELSVLFLPLLHVLVRHSKAWKFSALGRTNKGASGVSGNPPSPQATKLIGTSSDFQFGKKRNFKSECRPETDNIT
jgi:hypothetical protein